MASEVDVEALAVSMASHIAAIDESSSAVADYILARLRAAEAGWAAERDRAEQAERERDEALKLAWPGEHRFPDQSYRAMYEDVVPRLRAAERRADAAGDALDRAWAERDEARADLARCIDVARRAGWNGIENPKALWDFFARVAEERDAVRAQRDNIIDAHSEGMWMARALDAESRVAELEAELSRWRKSFGGHVYVEDEKYTNLVAIANAAAAAHAAWLEAWGRNGETAVADVVVERRMTDLEEALAARGKGE